MHNCCLQRMSHMHLAARASNSTGLTLNQSPEVLLLQIPQFVQHLRSLLAVSHTTSRIIFSITLLQSGLKGLSVINDGTTITPNVCSPWSWAICFSTLWAELTLQKLSTLGAAGSAWWRGKLYFMLVGFYIMVKKRFPESPSVFFQYKTLIFCGKGGVNMGQRHPYETPAVYDYPIPCHIKTVTTNRAYRSGLIAVWCVCLSLYPSS